MAHDLVLGTIPSDYSRGSSSRSRSAESLGIFAAVALLTIPRVGRSVETGYYHTAYRRHDRPTREVPVVPMRSLAAELSVHDSMESPSMYRGDTRITQEIPASVVADSLRRVYGARRCVR